jgi:predicted tellurium resistance membrane protein TerC
LNNLLALLGIVGPVAIMIALVIMALLSQRLGAVTKRPPLYRWFYVSVALVGISMILRVVSLDVPDLLEHDYATAILHDVLMAAGLSLALIVTWRYWSWLLHESGTGQHVRRG